MLALLPSLLLLLVVQTHCSPVRVKRNDVKVTLDGQTYINKGIVGFGVIPSDFVESTGDTLGGIGSAVALKNGSWRKLENGTFTGTFIAHPDRGYNVEETIDYQARQHEIDFWLNPYEEDKGLSYDDAKETLILSYVNTTLQFERNGAKTTGLDATSWRAAENGYPSFVFADPDMPVPLSINRLSMDVEGIVSNADGSFWISDEYGPYIYRFSDDGNLIQTIQPPEAILPYDSKGNLSFTSDDDPERGRGANAGFEGLTIDAENQILYAMLQAATIQDGGGDKTTSRYTRLVAYDVSDVSSERPALVGEWVVPLPISNSKGKTRASSEILFLGQGAFLSLSRDGDGKGGDDTKSKYKQADLFTIAFATDIHGDKYDDPKNPIAEDGKLNDDIIPAEYVSFVDYIDDDQLARFGLQNGGDNDETLIDAKWESLTIAPVGDADFPNDYFLFTLADNDFISTHGISLGEPFDAGDDVDNQFLVFRVTLPVVAEKSLARVLGI
ncbi:esterase-like activity of phytase-domain-containing protein [Mucidula mucida]|nr:esterase-like activity of phytase-domain-containing protein [Mucidula mucida]